MSTSAAGKRERVLGTGTDSPYGRAALGFRNYWYPVCLASEVGQRPKAFTLLGEPIALVRRRGQVFAVQNECPHRGAAMALGKDEFPGSYTLSCRFHGWTFDVRDGTCVAALTDGPDSPVVGRVRLRTYPAEVRKGIVWVWMGSTAPVPLEDDVPHLLLREDTIVKVHTSYVEGNWRYHAEGGAGGHFQMLHKDAIAFLLERFFAYAQDYDPVMAEDPVDGGTWVFEHTGPIVRRAAYPGLGQWPQARPWRRFSRGGTPPFGISPAVAMRLPCILRSPASPRSGAVYYEWYVPCTEDRYLYFQVDCLWARNPVSWLYQQVWYHLWGGPFRRWRFNNQDKLVVPSVSAFEKRRGANHPTHLYRPDRFPLAWIRLCNEQARGETPMTQVDEQTPAAYRDGGQDNEGQPRQRTTARPRREE